MISTTVILVILKPQLEAFLISKITRRGRPEPFCRSKPALFLMRSSTQKRAPGWGALFCVEAETAGETGVSLAGSVFALVLGAALTSAAFGVGSAFTAGLSSALPSALGAAALVVVFLAVVAARLRVVVLAAGFASTAALASGSEGASSTLTAGFAVAFGAVFAAAFVVAAFVVVDFVAVVFLAVVAFLAVAVLVAVVFLAAVLAGAFAAGLASAASAFT